jgi:hypothetical protein
LFLAFAQAVGAAKVRRDARQHVTESTRDLEPRVAVNEQLSAIGHPAAPFRRARDHLAGQLPVPNCSHDKSALSGYTERYPASLRANLASGYRTFQRRSPFSQLQTGNQRICRQAATRPQKNFAPAVFGGPGRWCDVFEIRDWKIQRVFIYLAPDYAGKDTARYPWLNKK